VGHPCALVGPRRHIAWIIGGCILGESPVTHLNTVFLSPYQMKNETA
jgi:hypothetical protein